MGRDVSVSSPLPPGTLLLSESALITYTNGDGDGDGDNVNVLDFSAISEFFGVGSNSSNSSNSSVRNKYKKSTASILASLAALSPLHPRSLSDLPLRSRSSRIKELKSLYQPQIDAIVAAAPAACEVTELLLLRLWFVISLNGYDSGLGLTSAMFNHSDRPNAVRYFEKGHCEVYATRRVERGEGVRIGYLNPREQSLERRRDYFNSQHYFDLNGSENGSENENETEAIFDRIGEGGDAEAVKNVEKTVEELENELSELSQVFALLRATPEAETEAETEAEAGDSDSLSSIRKLTIRAGDLSTASQILVEKASERLANPLHFLVARSLRLNCDSCDLFIRVAEFEATTKEVSERAMK